MAFENRDYMRDESRRYGAGGGFGGGGFRGGGRPRLGTYSVTTWMLILNVAVFLWDGIFGHASRLGFMAIYPWGFFSVDHAIYGLQAWRFVTYQFLHADFFHLLFNMIGVFFFAPLIEQHLGPRRFVVFYLVCGIGGAVAATLLGAIPGLGIMPTGAQLVGASGALFGILVACAVLFPHQRVQLIFPPIPMSMRTMALVFLGIAALSVIAGSANAGGQAAHLGGALLGLVLIKNPRSLGWADRLSPAAIQAGVNEGRYQRKVEKRHAAEAEVDRILAKVKEQGLHSLTRKEKKALAAATDSQRRGR